MKLKDRNTSPVGGFAFYYENPQTKEEIRVPEIGKNANGLSQLVQFASSALAQNGMEVPPNLGELIEHQICLRQPNPKSSCFSGGIGDDIHHKVMKPLMRSVARGAERFGFQAIANMVKSASNCGSCGGTKTYQQGKNNLGRAGKLNNQFALNADYKR